MLRTLPLLGLAWCFHSAVMHPSDECATPTPTPSASTNEHECVCLPNQTWIDVVLVVDKSASMGSLGLTNIVSTLTAIFYDLTIGQDMKYQTRVGLIAYDATATAIANLSQYTGVEDLLDGLDRIKQSTEQKVNLKDALQLAGRLIGWANQPETRQTVVVAVASAYDNSEDGDPLPAATQMHTAGIKLVTVAVIENDEGGEQFVKKIGELASDGYAYLTDKSSKTNSAVLSNSIEKAFCNVNCFCPQRWYQLTDDFNKPTQQFAECVRLSSTPSNWYGATRSCARQSARRAFLASEFSLRKHQYNVDYVRKIKGSVVDYLIGLSYDDATGRYLWEEKYPNGTHIPLDPHGFHPWYNGTENHALGTIVEVTQRGFDTYWLNVQKTSKGKQYMCQVRACDTNNYCDDTVNED